MKRCAKKLSKWLYIQGAIEESDMELYEYGAYVLLINIVPLLLSLTVGSIMGLALNGVLFITPFVLIRKFSGGFHAKRADVCFILSVVIISLGIYLTKEITLGIPLHIIMIWSVISLILLSPIDSENRRLSVKEKRIYRNIASGLVIIFFTIYIVLCICKKEEMAVSISLGIILIAGMQLICLMKDIEQICRQAKT